MNIMKRVNIVCHSFQKVKPIYYIYSLHRVKYFKPLSLEILMSMAYRYLKPEIQCLRKLEHYQLLVPLAVWAGAKSCWKMKSASL